MGVHISARCDRATVYAYVAGYRGTCMYNMWACGRCGHTSPDLRPVFARAHPILVESCHCCDAQVAVARRENLSCFEHELTTVN